MLFGAGVKMLLLGGLVLSSWAAADNSISEDLGGATYELSPSDEIEVFVWKEEELSRKMTIRPDGGISYPLVGEVQAAGQSISSLQSLMQDRIREYVPSAVVSVSLVKVSGYRIYVLGEVNNPGEFVLNHYVTVAQALTLADGLTPYAKQSDIVVVREQDGEEGAIKFDYKRFKHGRDLERNIQLRAGDIVSVP